ncbi:hypothetical protein NDU88_006918 [Pleurodeles waltl]|uniref:Uncharacterized protein n=1 Tax=Pleurodeles waltl TaxID=8319 RepID=A0AAV7N8Q5_PLEWA|nr:hypothetical protein NDU88_006918 [Pleurodeles waltl]
MRTCGQKGVGAVRASFSKGARAPQALLPQAPLAIESDGEHDDQPFEERQLGGAAKMAAPSELMELSVEEENFLSGEGSHMFMAEQENKAVIIIDSEEEGSAQLGQKVLGQEQRAYLSGCVAPHVSSGHGVLVEHQLSGRSAGGPITVGVRAPPGRRIEERAQSGAVRLTAREVTPMEVRSVESNARGLDSRSYSRSAILGGEEEEELDYGDDGEQVEAPQASTSGQALRGEQLSRREVAANLSRGCVGGPEGCCIVWIVGHSFVRWAEKQVATRHFGKQLGLDGSRIKSGVAWSVPPFQPDGGLGGVRHAWPPPGLIGLVELATGGPGYPIG